MRCKPWFHQLQQQVVPKASLENASHLCSNAATHIHNYAIEPKHEVAQVGSLSVERIVGCIGLNLDHVREYESFGICVTPNEKLLVASTADLDCTWFLLDIQTFLHVGHCK